MGSPAGSCGWNGGGGLGFLEEEGLMKEPKGSRQETRRTPGECGAQNRGDMGLRRGCHHLQLLLLGARGSQD